MEKVKVTRYMPGKRPDYARDSSSSSSSSEDEDEEEEEEEGKVREEEQVEENRKEYGDEEVARDRRLARLRERTTHVERYVNIKYSCTMYMYIRVFDKLTTCIWHTIGPESFLFGTAQFSLSARMLHNQLL